MKLLIFLFFITSLFADVRVATAGNVAFAIKDLANHFYQKTHIKVIPVISSSGNLTNQIRRGAPFDVFLSANMKYPEFLYQNKLAITKPKIYAKGRLVLFAKNGIKNIYELFSAKRIAIANPKTAPYGKATIEYLKNKHLYAKLKNKFIIAGNISSTFNYALQVTNYGFIAKSLLFKFPNLNNKNHYIDLDTKYYSPINQGIVLLKNKPEAKKFYNFIFSKEAKEIFLKYGYIIN